MATRTDLLAALAPLTRALRRIEDAAAAEVGLTMWQYAILAVVGGSDQLNQAEVADRLGYSKNRIVADLDLLERRSLLVRQPAPDRRANLLRVTPSGAALERQVREDVHRGEDELLATLDVQQRADVLGAIRTMTHALEEQRANKAGRT
jgi:DNA-binding MarR family transcriptional regulator